MGSITTTDRTAGQEGCTVNLRQYDILVQSAKTQESGEFEFKDINPGRYTVEITGPGGHYQSCIIENVLVSADRIACIDLLLLKPVSRLQRKSLSLKRYGEAYWSAR